MVYPDNGILSGNKNKELVHPVIWMNLEKIMFSERNQTQRSHMVELHLCEC